MADAVTAATRALPGTTEPEEVLRAALRGLLTFLAAEPEGRPATSGSRPIKAGPLSRAARGYLCLGDRCREPGAERPR